MTKQGSTNITERVGQTVLYTLNEADAHAIMQRRRQLGSIHAPANDVRDGDTYPAIIVRDFGLSGTAAAQQARTRLLNRTLTARYRKSKGKTDPEAEAEAGFPTEYASMTEADFAQHKAAELQKAVVSWLAQARQAAVNLRVQLDGYDEYWATSRSLFDEKVHGRMEQRTVNESGSDEGDWIPDPRGHWQVIA